MPELLSPRPVILFFTSISSSHPKHHVLGLSTALEAQYRLNSEVSTTLYKTHSFYYPIVYLDSYSISFTSSSCSTYGKRAPRNFRGNHIHRASRLNVTDWPRFVCPILALHRSSLATRILVRSNDDTADANIEYLFDVLFYGGYDIRSVSII